MLKRMGEDVAVRVIAGVLVVLVLFFIGKVFGIALLSGVALKKALKPSAK